MKLRVKVFSFKLDNGFCLHKKNILTPWLPGCFSLKTRSLHMSLCGNILALKALKSCSNQGCGAGVEESEGFST